MNIWRKVHLVMAGVLLAGLWLAADSWAELVGLGPPVQPHGYPWYYEDNTGLQLQLCLDDNGMCIFDPIDQDNPDSVALGVGDESFWWMADVDVRNANGRARLVLALEAAFGGLGEPVIGEQISFGRVRVRFDAPQSGNYRVIHPYGQLNFSNVPGGERFVFTEDIGAIDFLNPEAAFAGALQSQIGPFLTWPDYATNPALQRVVEGEPVQYVGDPDVPNVVTGSPFGTNFFRIERETAPETWVVVYESDLFAVMGKVLSPNVMQPPLYVYGADRTPTLFAVGPVNRPGDVGEISELRPEGVRTGVLYEGYPVGFPLWYQEWAGDVGGLQLTICPGSDPMCISDPIDPNDAGSVALGVGEEAFWWSADAFLNARTPDATVPAGLDGRLILALEGTFGGAGEIRDGSQIAFGRVRIRIDVPTPGTYTVTYPYGVQVFENVTVDEGINFTRDLGSVNPSDPDSAFIGALFGEIGPRFLIWTTFNPDPEQNDPRLQRPLDPNNPETIVQYVGDPAIPHAVMGSPNNTNFFRVQGPGGIDVVTALFEVSGKVYDVGSFQVIPTPDAPVAVNDTQTTNAGVPVVIDILANDTIGALPVDPNAVTVTVPVIPPQDGEVILNPDNTVTYTPDAGFDGTDSFTYRITDNTTELISNDATVTIQVLPVIPPEAVTVQNARLQVRQARWDIRGRATIDGVTLSIYAGPNFEGPIIAEDLLVNRGKWEYRAPATFIPDAEFISIRSSTGNEFPNIPLRVQ